MKKRVLFLIHDLGPGGAEKVLVNLVNGLDREKFEVSLRTLFDWGPNRDALAADVRYSAWIGRDLPANSRWMKLWTPAQLWKKIIPEPYDIVVSFLEGPCARVVGGVPADGPKTVCWIHTPLPDEKKFTEGFRNRSEAEACYAKMDAIVFVSGDVQRAFQRFFPAPRKSAVLYNVFDSDRIRELSACEPVDLMPDPDQFNWCGIGKLVPLKGWTRMLEIQRRLRDENLPAHFYLIGDGPQRNELEKKAEELGVKDSVTFTGYLKNPYAVLSRCGLFVCASEREGMSTAAVESMIVGTPVCTVDIGGMKEILGEQNEFGVVTANDDGTLFQAVRKFLTDPAYRDHYKAQAAERGRFFSREQALKAVENFLLDCDG